MIKGIKKRLKTFAFMMLVGGLSLQAQNAVKMTTSDGEEMLFVLSVHPMVTLSEEGFVIQTDDEKIVIETNGSLVFQFVQDDNNSVGSFYLPIPTFKINSISIEAYNLTPGSTIEIFDLAGRKIKSKRIDSQGTLCLPISDLGSGCYIVNSADKKFKFYKK